MTTLSSGGPGADGVRTRGWTGGRYRALLARRGVFNWRLALVLTAVNSVVIAVMVAVVPGITTDPDRPVFHLVLLAMGYGLLNAFVKPLVQFFALSYLVATYGLVLLAINALMLWLLSTFSFGVLRIDGLVPLLVGTIVARAVTLPLESMFGTKPPVLDHSSILEVGP